MLISILGALMAGLVVSFAVPFVPFAGALTVSVFIGAVWTTLHGHPFAVVALGALALLVATQVGYGLGLLLFAVLVHKDPKLERASGAEKGRREIRDLRFGKES